MAGGTLIAGSMTLDEVCGHGDPNDTDPSPSVRATGTFNLSGNTATATVNGNLTLGHHTSTGTAAATGLINVTGGTLNVTGNLVEGTGGATSISTVNLEDGTLTVGGDLIVDTLNFTGGTLHVGTLGFDLEQNGGTLAPGNSPGTTYITGDYDLNSGVLQIEMNEYDQGADPGYDFVNVSGDANLNGTLAVVFLDGFKPAVGDFFDVLTAADITLGLGVFGLDQSAAPWEGGFVFSVVVGGNGEILRLSAVPEPASLIILALGGLCLAFFRRRRR